MDVARHHGSPDTGRWMGWNRAQPTRSPAIRVSSPAMHDPVAPLLLRLAAPRRTAKLAGWLAVRARQPAVLGEILIGILLGNLTLLGFDALEPIGADPVLAMLASLGIIVLMFEVGLQSTVKEMLSVGRSSTLVAILGVVTPFLLGWAVGAIFLPERST